MPSVVALEERVALVLEVLLRGTPVAAVRLPPAAGGLLCGASTGHPASTLPAPGCGASVFGGGGGPCMVWKAPPDPGLPSCLGVHAPPTKLLPPLPPVVMLLLLPMLLPTLPPPMLLPGLLPVLLLLLPVLLFPPPPAQLLVLLLPGLPAFASTGALPTLIQR